VDFWNSYFLSLGTGFRLGELTHTVGQIPIDVLYAIRKRGSRRGDPEIAPDSIRNIEGSVIVALSESDASFNSFTYRWPLLQKALVVVRQYPSTLPGATRNVVAHEFGHVVGLGHNSKEATLMWCGAAWCHLKIPGEGFFPLTKAERTRLLQLYPPGCTERVIG